MDKIIKNTTLVVLFATLSFSLLQNSYSKNLIGKIYSERDVSRSHILPLLTDDDLVFSKTSILRFTGGSIVAYEGSKLKAVEDTEYLTFIIDKGTISFKLDPAKRSFLFKTDNGSVVTPKILKTSSNLIEGKISIEENNSTIVEVNSGELDTITPEGMAKIEQGQAVVLTRADYKVAQGDPEVKPAQTSSGSIYTKDQLPPGLREYLDFFGEKGTAVTRISKKGKITVVKDEFGYDRKARAVDFALFELDKELEEGTPVKVVCGNINKGIESSEFFVRETDNLYPQLITEKNLLGKSIKTQTVAAPHGLSELEDDTAEKSADEKARSYDKWDTAIIDPQTLQPDFSERVSEGTDLTVVCIRSTLVLQPVETASSQYLGMVGKNAVASTEITPFGKINVDGNSYDAILTDLNLQPKKLSGSFPEGTSFTVVGVKEEKGNVIVLIQEKDEVLEELLAVGQDVKLLETSDAGWGVVELSNNKWWGKIVGKDFLPIDKAFPANTKFKVASIDTVLLANEPSVLASAFLPAASPLIPLLIGGIIIPPAVIVPPIIDDDNNDPDLSPTIP